MPKWRVNKPEKPGWPSWPGWNNNGMDRFDGRIISGEAKKFYDHKYVEFYDPTNNERWFFNLDWLTPIGSNVQPIKRNTNIKR